MKDITVNISAGTNDLFFKPELIAMEHLGEMPSYIQLSALEIPLSFVKSMIANSPKIYKAYENINVQFAEHVDKLENIMDRFVVFNNSDKFCTKQEENDIVLYFYLETEAIPVVLGKEPFFEDANILIYYNANKTSDESLKKVLTEILKHCKIDDEEYIDNNSYISLVTKDSNGNLNTKEFAIKDPKINLPLAYGEEFKKIDKDIFSGLKKSDKGIWIFHGPPGTGKSMYIRNLIKRLNKLENSNDIIYMSSEMIASLESPDFLPFIQDYKDSVLVIEDADIALESRKSQGSIVKTVLQLTDGILADCLRLKIIATFNCDLSQIDEALLRKGRLQYRHEFRYLSKEEAIKLGVSLKLSPDLFNTEEYKNKTEWTLAEIYNIKQDFYWDRKKSRMGFNLGK